MSSSQINIAIALSQFQHTDGELVRRAIEGDRWAEEVLYRNHVPTIFTFCLRMLCSKMDAEDVVQETFIQAFAALDTLREPDKFKAWLMRIAFYRTQRVFRKRNRGFRLFSSKACCDTPLEQQTVSNATQEQRTELLLLDSALGQMTSEERACWILRYLENYQIKEIVLMTGLSKNTVKRRISAAQDTVNTHFGENIHE